MIGQQKYYCGSGVVLIFFDCDQNMFRAVLMLIMGPFDGELASWGNFWGQLGFAMIYFGVPLC